MSDSENVWFNRVMARSLACTVAVIWLAFLIQDGTWPLAFLSLAAVAVVLGVLIGFRKVRSLRKVPDYAAIARMEREIYGEAFGHEGAPATGGIAVLNPDLLVITGNAVGDRPWSWEWRCSCGTSGGGSEKSSTDAGGACTDDAMRHAGPDCSWDGAWARGEGPAVRSPALAAHSKTRPVRYAACPQGHPRWPWAEEYGQWCPVCHDKLILSSSGVPGPVMGTAADEAAFAELARSLKALDGWMDRL